MSLENRSYHGLESLDAFDFVPVSEESAKPENDAEMEFKTEERTPEVEVQDSFFWP